MEKKPRVSIIAAIGKNRVLGKNNQLLWHIPEDLKRFKTLTLGHPVIMGRKTFESIIEALGKPLLGRTNIVVTRSIKDRPLWSGSEVQVVHSIEEALARAAELNHEEIFIIGGGQIYAQALPYADRLYLTLIDDEKGGDSYFPEYEKIFTKQISEESGEHNGLKYRFVTLKK